MNNKPLQQFFRPLGMGLFVVISFVLGGLYGRPAATTAQQPQGGGGLIPRFMSLPAESATTLNGANYVLNGGGDLSGLALPGNQVIPRFAVGFTLPPDYAPGTDVVLRMTWGNSRYNAITCGFRMWVNGVSRFRADGPPYYPAPYAVFPNGLDEITLLAPDTSEQIRATTITIAGQDSLGNDLHQPGDVFSVLIARRADDVNDTCAGTLYVLGLDMTYEGLSSYLPMITKN